MAIGSLCSKKPILIDRDASIQSAAKLMKERNVGSLVVMSGEDGASKPVGLLTDRDIALKLFSKGISAESPVEKIMSKGVHSTRSDTGIAEVVDQMEKSGVRRILVQDEKHRLCGVVSADDILQLVGREIYGIGRLIEKQSSTKRSARAQ